MIKVGKLIETGDISEYGVYPNTALNGSVLKCASFDENAWITNNPNTPFGVEFEKGSNVIYHFCSDTFKEVKDLVAPEISCSTYTKTGFKPSKPIIDFNFKDKTLFLKKADISNTDSEYLIIYKLWKEDSEPTSWTTYTSGNLTDDSYYTDSGRFIGKVRVKATFNGQESEEATFGV